MRAVQTWFAVFSFLSKTVLSSNKTNVVLLKKCEICKFVKTEGLDNLFFFFKNTFYHFTTHATDQKNMFVEFFSKRWSSIFFCHFDRTVFDWVKGRPMYLLIFGEKYQPKNSVWTCSIRIRLFPKMMNLYWFVEGLQ